LLKSYMLTDLLTNLIVGSGTPATTKLGTVRRQLPLDIFTTMWLRGCSGEATTSWRAGCSTS
jgi:hypothetical protein